MSALGWHRLRARRTDALHRALTEERRRLASDLHDTLAQGLTATTFHLQAALDTVGANPRAQQHIQRAQALMSFCVSDARRAVWGLHPEALAELGLVDALRRLTQEWMAATPLEIRLESHGLTADRADAVPARVQSSVFRVVQEALTNAVKYSRARVIRVWLSRVKKQLRVVVEDDGCGFPAEGASEARPRLGLPGMRERVRELGGRIWIGGRSGHSGAVVEVTIPLP